MRARTVRDLGAAVRSARRAQGLTQADLAARLGVGRDWVVRLEQGQPRLEAQKVLDAVDALGLVLDVREPTADPRSRTTPTTAEHSRASLDVRRKGPPAMTDARADPFDELFGRTPGR